MHGSVIGSKLFLDDSEVASLPGVFLKHTARNLRNRKAPQQLPQLASPVTLDAEEERRMSSFGDLWV